MNLVDKEDWRGRIEETIALCTLDNLTYILHTTRHCRERKEWCLQPLGYDLDQGGLPHARRSP